MKFEWKTLRNYQNSLGGFNTLRAKVFGGWVLKNMCWDNKYKTQSESMVFISDPSHEWEIK